MAFLAATISAESLIEVDENGDEYELKRFYIQGRQLKGDGSQSQCVVTRRKRSGRAHSVTKPGETGASVQVSSQTLNVESLPAMMEHREGAATLQEVDPSKRRYVALTGVHYEPHVPNDDDDDDEDQEDEDDDDDEELEDETLAGQSPKSQSQFVPAALALPLAQGSQVAEAGAGGDQASTAAVLPQGVSVVANAASHANVAEDAGIVVVQSHQPPKVNPDTHAVFELKPIQADVQQPAVSFYPFVHPWEVVQPEDEDDYDEDDYDEEDYDDFYYGGYYRDQPGYVGLGEYDEHIVSEDSPMSTTAVWTTNDDSDIHPVINQANKRPNQNKNKNKNKNKNSNKKNPKRKSQTKQKNKKRISHKKRKPETELSQKKKDQKKKQQDKEQQVQEMQQDQMLESPVDVIKKPAAAAASSAQSSISSSSSSSSMSSVSNSSGSNSSAQKKKKKKTKKPSSSSSSGSSKRRTKKKKKQSSSSSSSSLSTGNRRRRPSFSSSSSSSSSIGGYRRRRPQLTQQQKRRQQQQRRRRKQQNNRRRLQQQKRRRNRNKNRQFYGDEPIINCIYINKDPPTTTTPRPFWNILGRQSDDQKAKDTQAPGQDTAAVEPVDPVAKQAVLQAVRRNFGDFGGRKRTNLRFVA
ncbi:hypothetical protein KR054_004695 [Drosophila jambulina]|nr:hypothetical protein KR054_004695 [Drosophila jambulina]